MKPSNRAQMVIATTAVLLSLTACGQKDEATIGLKIDGAMTSTETAERATTLAKAVEGVAHVTNDIIVK